MTTSLLHARFVQCHESRLVALEKRPEIGTRFLQRSGPDGFLEWQVCAFNQNYADSVLAHSVGMKKPEVSSIIWTLGCYTTQKV